MTVAETLQLVEVLILFITLVLLITKGEIS
ncbi:Uncharacterized [Moorella glycerini]|uniref:Uncharacterized protein n=1 Tax=Neomoorella stamsii TaxID=1266720 RepID=A0A9X7J5H8_9FIRM|nr:hypothetical protein MOST_01920 [Moorella stamsii]CEP69358.1 Uncharacterized [Moorella glycerini]